MNMTTLEIANVTGKPHGTVIAEVRKHLGDMSEFYKTIKNKNKVAYSYYLLPKELTMNLGCSKSYSYEQHQAVVNWWHAVQGPPVYTTELEIEAMNHVLDEIAALHMEGADYRGIKSFN